MASLKRRIPCSKRELFFFDEIANLLVLPYNRSISFVGQILGRIIAITQFLIINRDGIHRFEIRIYRFGIKLPIRVVTIAKSSVKNLKLVHTLFLYQRTEVKSFLQLEAILNESKDFNILYGLNLGSATCPKGFKKGIISHIHKQDVKIGNLPKYYFCH